MILLLAACGSSELTITPNPLAWGEVDFQVGPPAECDPDEGGCVPTSVEVVNTGEKAFESVSAPGFDGDHICVEGFEAGAPIELGPLEPGARYVLGLSVCGYGPTERDSEVSGQIRFTGGKAEATLDWSFTPIRDMSDDTGP